jgi:cytidine deaminase
MSNGQAIYQKLLDTAKQAAENSYSPYSRFPVGAALLSEDGRVFTGCNVENASYSAGVCAERTAVLKAVSEGCRRFKAIAVACLKNADGWPCGICRQFMSEFGVDLEVVVEGSSGKVQVMKLSELLPRHFGPDSL